MGIVDMPTVRLDWEYGMLQGREREKLLKLQDISVVLENGTQ